MAEDVTRLKALIRRAAIALREKDAEIARLKAELETAKKRFSDLAWANDKNQMGSF